MTTTLLQTTAHERLNRDFDRRKQIKEMTHGQVFSGPAALGDDAPALGTFVDERRKKYWVVGTKRAVKAWVTGDDLNAEVHVTTSPLDAAARFNRLLEGGAMHRALEIAFG